MYRHSQMGFMILATVGIAALAIIVAVSMHAMPGGALWLALVLLVLLWIFCSVTVTVDAELVSVRFGVGLVRRRFKVAEIRGVTVVRNRWLYGWGVHRLQHGWLYNVSGLDAVEIELANGEIDRIGTDEPQELAAAIRRASGLTAKSSR